MLIGILKMILSSTLTGAGIGIVLCLFGLVMAHVVSFTFITETVGESKRQTYKVFLVSSFSLGGFMNVIWYFLIPNY